METVKILEKPNRVGWDYDEEADVLYLSLGQPAPAIGIDIGDGVILRYDEPHREVVGLTIVGVRARLLKQLAAAHENASEEDVGTAKDSPIESIEGNDPL